MPYLTIVQAAEATGKSEKTIRRLANRPDSKSYVIRDGSGPNAPVQIDSNYLSQVYPMSIGKPVASGQDNIAGQSIDTSIHAIASAQIAETQADYIAFLKDQLKKKEEEVMAKDRRIEDLTDKLTNIRLLTEKNTEEKPEEKKKKGWFW